MKAEAEFIKKLEVYFDEDFNEYTKKRIIGYLNEYKSQIPAIIINKKEKPIIIEKYYRSRLEKIRKDMISPDMLLLQAQSFCKEHNISIAEFTSRKGLKSKQEIINYRKKFCLFIIENFLCSNNQLADFFEIDHSTISYYLYGKRHRKLLKNNNIVQNKL